MPPVDLFISHASSPKDEQLLLELEPHLAILERQGLIRAWHRGRMIAGQVCSDEIKAQLEAANVVLLLVSSDFLGSEDCWGGDMTAALERHRARKCAVIPVILRPCDLEGAPFAGLAQLPRGGKPVTSWSNRDEAWASVVEGVRAAIGKLRRP